MTKQDVDPDLLISSAVRFLGHPTDFQFRFEELKQGIARELLFLAEFLLFFLAVEAACHFLFPSLEVSRHCGTRALRSLHESSNGNTCENTLADTPRVYLPF